MRSQFGEAIILALAFGAEEPPSELLYDRFVWEQHQMQTSGVWLRLEHSDIDVLVVSEVIAVVADCPAVSGLFNMTQGYFRCFFMKHEAFMRTMRGLQHFLIP